MEVVVKRCAGDVVAILSRLKLPGERRLGQRGVVADGGIAVGYGVAVLIDGAGLRASGKSRRLSCRRCSNSSMTRKQ